LNPISMSPDQCSWIANVQFSVSCGATCGNRTVEYTFIQKLERISGAAYAMDCLMLYAAVHAGLPLGACVRTVSRKARRSSGEHADGTITVVLGESTMGGEAEGKDPLHPVG
jgi:hypothetical protein